MNNNQANIKQSSIVVRSPRQKKKMTSTVILFVVGGLLTLSLPIAHILFYVASFFMAICFSLLCFAMPFMLPLVIPEGGEIDDVFANIFQGILDDRPANMNSILTIFTVVGVGILIVAVILWFKNK